MAAIHFQSGADAQHTTCNTIPSARDQMCGPKSVPVPAHQFFDLTLLKRLRAPVSTLLGTSVLIPQEQYSTFASKERLHCRQAINLPTLDKPAAMASSSSTMNSQFEGQNIVSWALSGDYDPNKPVLIDAMDPSRHITKTRAVKLVVQLAGAFKEDSTVCLHLMNDILYPILSLAIYASKCRWTGTNVSSTVDELDHHLRIAEAKYVVTDVDHLETVAEAVKRSGTDAEIILFSDIVNDHSFPPPCCDDATPDQRSSLRTLHDLLGKGTPETLRAAIQGIDSSSIAALMTTSGTTGRPKMAARTHAAIIHETAAISEDDHNLKPYEVRRLYCTPMFHAFSMPEMCINTLRIGFSAYFMKRFDASVFPQKICEFQVTETLAPPPMLLRLINSPACHHQLQTLRTIYTGGAALVPELRVKLLKIFSGQQPRITQVFGMTEGGWFTTFKYPENDESGSVGRALPGYEVKMSSDSSSQLSHGRQTGEILVRGPQVMSRYWGNPEATQKAFTEDGWLRTGDIGYIEDGKVYLVDRAKDLIKVNGWQVAPVEIEDALLKSPKVKDSGVIGFGEDVNEHPLAFVVRADDSTDVTAQSLKNYMLLRLSRYKVQSCEIRFIDEIPKSPAGKILKTELRRLAVE